MKMTKKVLFGAAILAMVFGFASCKNEDDDPEGAIKGSNNDYAVSYDNTNGYAADVDGDTKDTSFTGVYRAWNRTTWKHLGALTKITLSKGSESEGAGLNSGVMGFAWDLQTADGADAVSDQSKETFNVVGLRNYGGYLSYYVSRYYNISDKQKNNFGATTSVTSVASYPTVATEYDVTKDQKKSTWVNLNDQKLASSTSETSVWIDVAACLPVVDAKLIQAQTLAAVKNDSKWTAGAWVVAFYMSDPTESADVTPVDYVIIPAATSSDLGSGYAAAADSTNKIQKIDKSGSQKKQAVYANIYKGHILKGSWHYAATYKEAEAIADAE